MVDFEAVGQRSVRDRCRAKLRALVVVVMTAAAFVACGRSEVELLASDERAGASATGGASAIAGGAAMPAGSHAGAPAGSALGGAAGSALGGAAGSALSGAAGVAPGGNAGTAGSARAVETCDPARIPHFDGPPAIETLSPADASVAGDWNGDGQLDLAVSNQDGSVSVLLGSGIGSFVSSVAYTSLEVLLMRPGMTSIATSDLDDDGSLDLVVANREGQWVSVLLGAANGTFGSGTTYEVEPNPYGIALGDFDGDGITDIAAASFTGAVSVLHGQGDGRFGSRVVTAIGDQPRSMVAADLNHDGQLDLVTLGYVELAVLLGKGDGSFTKAHVYETSTTNHSVSLADFDADGHADLALTITCGMSAFSQTGVQILLGHGDGTFSSSVRYETKASCLDRILLTDVNGDGATDVVTSASSALLGQGDGSFAEETRGSKASGDYLLGAGDWNGDGKLDLATASERTIAVHLGDGRGNFGSSVVYATAVEPLALVLVDLDRDGKLDVASPTYDSRVGTNPNASKVSVLLGEGDGTFLDRVDYQSTAPAGRPAAMDLNGDGWPDLVTHRLDSRIGVWLGTGHAGLAPQITLDASANLAGFSLGDLNGDGHPDLALANARPDTVTLMLGNGDGTFSPWKHFGVATRPTDIDLFDANGDSAPDIALASHEAGVVSVLLGNGQGAFLPDQQYPTFDRQARVRATDLNADGNSDLVTWGAKALSIHYGTGDGSFARRLDYQGTATDILAADLNHDGHQDLVMTEGWPGSGLAILFGEGDGTFACSAHYAEGLQMAGLGVGDLNHDSRLDIATTTSAGVNVFLNPMP